MTQSYYLKDVAKWISVKYIQIESEVSFQYIITDSRAIRYPEQSLFIAIRGQNHNGHDYIYSLYMKGVRSFMVDSLYQIDHSLKDANFMVVENTLKSFQEMVSHKRSFYSVPVVGVTGSNGKTIVKEWVSQMIGKDKVVVRSPKSYNSQIGVPLSVWQMDSDTEVGVFEAGISEKGEMDSLASVINPTIGVLTNIGAAHEENFVSRKEKLQEKIKLFKSSDVVIYCVDHLMLEREMPKLLTTQKLITWGKGRNADLRIDSRLEENELTQLCLVWEGENFEIEIPFLDDISVENVMSAITTMLCLGYSKDYISRATKKLLPVAMRMELKEGVNDCILVNDSYNSDIYSLAISLDFLNQQCRRKNYQKTLILSDIYQSGLDDKTLCKQISDLIVLKGITRFIGVGKVLKANSDLFGLKSVFFDTTDALLNFMGPSEFKNEAILIKGSRNFELEKVCSVLERKHHQTNLQINLNALVHNLNYYRSYLKPTTKVLAMVKAFSYGSGSFEIANVLQHQKVDYLGVAFADEGVELRKAGITLPIIVMNPEARSFSVMLEYQLEPEIFNLKELYGFAEVVRKEGVVSTPVHIKLDTGMRRLGFMDEEMPDLIKALKEHEELQVKSAFSHLAGSDEEEFDDFTRQQIDLFTRMVKQLEDGIGYPVIKHILNSAGILRFTDFQFDMVRLGIGMYGIGAVDQKKLKTVTRFKSYISQLKRVKRHETIGYSRKGVLDYESEIAIVPVGYADGLRRKLGNGVGSLIVNHQKARIVGNVCMDMCMVDVTGLKAEEGTEVEIFGYEQSVFDLANLLDTIPYEVFTSISRRVKRVYFFE